MPEPVPAADQPEVALTPAPPRVRMGDRVEVELIAADGRREQLAFAIVAGPQADFEAGFLGASTPLARALLGQPVGATVSYARADAVAVRILAAAAGAQAPAPELAAARAAVVRQAVSRANLEDAVRLALTVDVKWGDYDPEALEAGWKEP